MECTRTTVLLEETGLDSRGGGGSFSTAASYERKNSGASAAADGSYGKQQQLLSMPEKLSECGQLQVNKSEMKRRKVEILLTSTI